MERLLVLLIRSLGYDSFKKLPESAARPVARVSLLGGPSQASNRPVWLDKATFQVDVWGDTDDEAEEAITAIREAILTAPRAQPVPDQVISFTTCEYPAYLPDSDWPVDGRPGPRYSMTVRISAHPAP